MRIKRINRGLIASLLSATTLVGCARTEGGLTVSEIRDVFASQESLTSMDENLNALKVEKYICSDEQPTVEGLQFISSSYPFKIEDLETELNKKPIVCDVEKCNDMLKATIGEILKTEVAEYLGVENEELVGFNVTGTRYYTNDWDSGKATFYTVELTYKDKRYKFVAENRRAHELCYRYRSCEKKELDYDGGHECYNSIKYALLYDAELSNDKKIVEGQTDKGENVTYEFDGELNLKSSDTKEDAVKRYVKEKKK